METPQEYIPNLEQGAEIEHPQNNFETWKKIKIGTIKTVEELEQAVVAKGNLTLAAKEIFSGKGQNFEISSTEQEIELVRIKVEELGFEAGAHIEDIYKKAEELGLSLCTPEVGAQVFLQGSGVVEGEALTIGMKPVSIHSESATRETLSIFRISTRMRKQLLGVVSAIEGEIYRKGSFFVFVK